MKKRLLLKYDKPAERTMEGWEQYSLPIGNGYAGASVFGGTDVERVQFTTNTFANTYKEGGVSSFAELELTFPEGKTEDYERGLDLTDGVAYSRFSLDGVAVEREAFFSYPDKVFAYRVQAKSAISFTVGLKIPYLGARPIEEGGRTGKVFSEGAHLVMRGELPLRELIYEGRVLAISDGQVRVEQEKIRVDGGTDTTVLFVMGTSYKLSQEVFLKGNGKAIGEDPHEGLVSDLEKAAATGWKTLYARHFADYAGLISRVEVDLGGKEDGRYTDELLKAYGEGEASQYLEEVYYAYGRHLLVSSSREGTPPASLQGVWSAHDKSPWGSGFWHNINIQMNYWLAFSANLAETFSAYVSYWKGYVKQAQLHAQDWIRLRNPENYTDGEGECGWVIGTGAYCYEIEGLNGNQHSGPGTVGLTAKLFWDYYDFTRDEKILREVAYPAVHGAAKFLTKTVRDYDGEILCSFSASPEQILSGDAWVTGYKRQKYYHTIGCAFDQQMLYENARDDIACADLLGVTDETTERERAEMERYHPVRVGYSGQIKEFAEENFYGEIGEAKHRHISQLVALMPGATITRSTPAWLDSAKLTLEMRGDESTGWALAHRFCAWARVGDGDHAYTLLRNLLKTRTYPNLWDVHPPFQIDGNFGATAGITEMLLQSHGGEITLFPAVPKAWKKLSFKGLKARGNFTLSASYADGKVEACEVEATVWGRFVLGEANAEGLTVTEKDSGRPVAVEKKNGRIEFETEKGKTYCITGFVKRAEPTVAKEFEAKWTEKGVALSWEACADSYALYRAVGDEGEYTLLCETDGTAFMDTAYSAENKARLTYKLVASKPFAGDARGALAVLHPAKKVEEERYALLFKQLNLDVFRKDD